MPELRTPDDTEDDYIPKSIAIALYEFEINFPNVTGFMKSLEATVNFSDLFETADGDPYSADSYNIEYEAAYVYGVPAVHSFVASILRLLM